MEKHIEVLCQHCNKKSNIHQTKLVPYYGKKVKLNCRHCNKKIPINVNAELFTKKKAVGKIFDTNIISKNKKEEKKKIIELQVIANEFTENQIIKLNIGENILGRASDTSANNNKRQIVTQDKLMSRLHCSVFVEKQNNSLSYVLKDLNSINGTYLNGKKMKPNDEMYIQENDIINIGNTEIKLCHI